MNNFLVQAWLWFSLTTGIQAVFAQSGTDLYIFSVQRTPDGTYHVYAPKYIAPFKEGGLIQDPYFTPAGDLMISGKRTGENQYDIWQLSLNQKKIKRLTITSSGEFAPQLKPDGQSISVLRRQAGDAPNQQVYTINPKTGAYKNMTENFTDILDYQWLSPHELALIRTNVKDTGLSYLDINDGKTKRITTSIGMKILIDKNGFLTYVHKTSEEYWYIKKYNPSSALIDVVALTPAGTDKFIILPDGGYLMAKDNNLYSIYPETQTTWNTISDLSIYGIKFITGMCISSDGKQLVLITTKDKP